MVKHFLGSTFKVIAFIVVFILLVVFNFRLWNKDRQNEQQIIKLQQELTLQQQENAKIASVNKDLKEKIEGLKQGSVEMIEEKARSGFGMVGEGETFYHFEDKDDKSSKK